MNHETIRTINSFAPWLSAVGTILAVGTTIYFARIDKRIRINLSAGYRLLASGPGNSIGRTISIVATNIGIRPVTICQFGWEFGRIRKRHLLQFANNSISDLLPITKRDGESASCNFHIDAIWLNKFIDSNDDRGLRNCIDTLHVVVLTSTGKTFKCKVEKNLRDKLKKYITSRDFEKVFPKP